VASEEAAGSQGSSLKPVLLVIAGPNGAGKTTVTARLRSEQWSEGVEYINPDEVARDRYCARSTALSRSGSRTRSPRWTAIPSLSA
jgi:predicted ABC-type ATPase